MKGVRSGRDRARTGSGKRGENRGEERKVGGEWSGNELSQYQGAQEVTETKFVSARHGSKTGRVRYQSAVTFLEVFIGRSGVKGCVSVSWKDIPQQLVEQKVASKKSLLTPCFHGEKTLHRGS